MTRIFIMVALAGLTLTVAAAERPLTYYVQLVRCNDQNQAPEPGSKRVGPKLAGKFQCVFRCTNYWEICQDKLEVPPDGRVRARLRNGREVEIDLREQGKRRVSTFHKGRLIDRVVEPASENMTLIGGDRDQTSHWFIVVRRDKPGQ